MPDIKYLSPGFAVSSQPELEDFACYSAMGFRAIINNRPDDEEDLPFGADAGRYQSDRFGMAYHHVPVTNHDLFDDEAIDALVDAVKAQPGAVLAHCRSGTRTAILWALAAARFQPADRVIAALAEVGIDVSFLESELADQAGRGMTAHPAFLIDGAALDAERITEAA